MSIDEDDQFSPSDPPDEGGTTEIPDEPMGVPAEGEPSVGDQPGIPDSEPPASG